jgi:8-oxo-dGTP pyrophosphatase MutT (NUDIX family)
VRTRILERLAARPPRDGAREQMLANVIGDLTPELEEMLARPGHRAAVLVGLVERSTGLNVLFTERAPHLANHPGQVSFPGGRLESAAETAVQAALREAREEVCLAADDVTVAGCLDVHITGTGFSVTPVVGFISGAFEPRPDPGEVSGVFEVPLDYLLDEANAREHVLERFGCRFRSYEILYGGYRIWGATAAILMSFKRAIS